MNPTVSVMITRYPLGTAAAAGRVQGSANSRASASTDCGEAVIQGLLPRCVTVIEITERSSCRVGPQLRRCGGTSSSSPRAARCAGAPAPSTSSFVSRPRPPMPPPIGKAVPCPPAAQQVFELGQLHLEFTLRATGPAGRRYPESAGCGR